MKFFSFLFFKFMISSLCSAASLKKYVSALWQFLCYLDQPVNSFPQARHLQIPSTVTMSSFPDPSFFSVFTDPSQVLFLKMCHPEMSLVFHMKLACRAWHFSVGFPSCSGERTSMATMTYKDASWDGLCRLPYLSNLSFSFLSPAGFVLRIVASYCSQIHEPIPTSELLLFCCPQHTTLPDACLALSSPLSVFNPMAPDQWILWPFYLPGLPFQLYFCLSYFLPPRTWSISFIYLFRSLQ